MQVRVEYEDGEVVVTTVAALVRTEGLAINAAELAKEIADSGEVCFGGGYAQGFAVYPA